MGVFLIFWWQERYRVHLSVPDVFNMSIWESRGIFVPLNNFSLAREVLSQLNIAFKEAKYRSRSIDWEGNFVTWPYETQSRQAEVSFCGRLISVNKSGTDMTRISLFSFFFFSFIFHFSFLSYSYFCNCIFFYIVHLIPWFLFLIFHLLFANIL